MKSKKDKTTGQVLVSCNNCQALNPIDRGNIEVDYDYDTFDNQSIYSMTVEKTCDNCGFVIQAPL